MSGDRKAAIIELWEVNTGERYDERREIARLGPKTAAVRMLAVAIVAARELERQGYTRFEAPALLEAAMRLLDYYKRHNAEGDALRKAEAAARVIARTER